MNVTAKDMEKLAARFPRDDKLAQARIFIERDIISQAMSGYRGFDGRLGPMWSKEPEIRDRVIHELRQRGFRVKLNGRIIDIQW
jgi:hypothetical protein